MSAPTTQTDTIHLVFGASGYIGSNLVPYLLSSGRRVRAVSRNREVLEGRGWSGVEIAQADAMEPLTLDAALDRVDVAYYLVHSMAAGKNFPELDAVAARNFAAAAERQGVLRIVYLGGLLPDSPPESPHLRSRQETGDLLRAGSVPVTEIRAGMIVGPGSAAWEVIRDLVNHLPVMITPRWVKSKSTPIALSNLLHYLAEVPAFEKTANEIYAVGGPDILTYLEIMRQYGELVGKRPYILQVPLLTPRLSSYWLRLVTTVPTSIARALIDGLSEDLIASDTRLVELIPQPLLGFRDAARAALTADRQHEVPARWTEGSIACRNFHPEYSFYARQTGDVFLTTARASDVWDVICTVGNNGDFFYARWLWWARRALDWLIGGPSLRRKRRHPQRLRVGDVVDSWRVIAMEPGTRLTLLMEMKAPGAGVAEYTVHNDDQGVRIEVRAYFHPQG
ncbi:MAG: DUF2867 domain-containing protein, partial [Gammaproteobacteria bacterium]|nr:DUF2867 domain-containing protein [Gammaproteobacteria bacterium]